MVHSTSGTLIRPPPPKPNEAPIESVLALLPLVDFGPDIFTNTRPLWHPPGARGIFGGAAIAQSLAAAQLTIPPPSPSNGNATFLIHSMHCYFVLAGDASIPVIYHVERVRDGKSFITRTVQACQRGKCIFTTTLSFVRENSAGAQTVDHQASLPTEVLAALECLQAEETEEWTASSGRASQSPFIAKRMDLHTPSSGALHEKRTRQWYRARGTISPSAGLEAHLSAMAYMSDSYFIGTVSRVHGLWRTAGPDATIATKSSKPLPAHQTNVDPQTLQLQKELLEFAERERRENPPEQTKRIGMMVSLDHTIYFHRPREVKADDWLFAEMSSPWAGDGRGLVFQRIWNKNGVHVATCIQEGLARLVQKGESVKELGGAKM
ncbi:MAG: hypothetical protein GOMPHAMPRED_004987 [Gomphillus americanus]|uniref:Acyl-CoA thioesterase 8 n=1 Tax=Gomphillus americanus TaxID=1940652 RepID=A0A8H3EMW5_9LECA|nr:MAG: hypothetical protein GOMPHAMPRED_004987 [Gomphillus americanus]